MDLIFSLIAMRWQCKISYIVNQLEIMEGVTFKVVSVRVKKNLMMSISD